MRLWRSGLDYDSPMLGTINKICASNVYTVHMDGEVDNIRREERLRPI